MKRIGISIKNLSLISLALSSIGFSIPSYANDFNVPFVNVSSMGVVWADWATATNDASATFTNPAGLTYLPKPQLVASAIGLQGHAQFKGTAQTPPSIAPYTITQSGRASSDLHAFMPTFYLSAPINNRFVFGFGVVVPFALGTTYATDSIVRYAATRSQVLAFDITPSLGIKINDKLSLGIGLDAVRLSFTLSHLYGPPVSFTGTEVQNHLMGWGLGWHAGVLYEIQPPTRIGFSFNSIVTPHTTGTSAVFNNPGRIKINSNKTTASLPARAQLSVQHDFTSKWTGMATMFYTNWRTFNQLTMKQVLTPAGGVISLTIPFNYHNTMDYSLGTSYKITDKWMIRGGVQFMNTPTNKRDRSVVDPIGSATIVAIGAHYQQNQYAGYDIGYGHSFFKQESVNNVNPLTSLVGHNNASTNLFGAQVTLNLA